MSRWEIRFLNRPGEACNYDLRAMSQLPSTGVGVPLQASHSLLPASHRITR